MNFKEFYNMNQDIYGEDVDTALDHYNDIMSEEDTNTEESITEEDLFSEFLENYGDNYGDIEDAYADFLTVYSDEDEFEDEDLEDEFEDEFEDEDLEDEFEDEFEDEDLEDEFEDEDDDYSDEAYAEGLKAHFSANKGRYIQGAGTAVGAGAGLLAGRMATKGSRRRIAELKAKGNNISAAEMTELKRLKRKVMAAQAGGAVAGGAVGHVGTAGIRGGVAGYQMLGKGGIIMGAKGAMKDSVKKSGKFGYDNVFSDVEEYLYADEEMDNIQLEMMDEYASFKGAYGATKSHLSANKNTYMGAAGGGIVGAGVAHFTDKNRAERSALRARIKTGNASEQEKTRFKQLVSARRLRMAVGSTAGIAVGAGAGHFGPGAVTKAKTLLNKKAKTAAPVTGSPDVNTGAATEDKSKENKSALTNETGSKDSNYSAEIEKSINASHSMISKLLNRK